jgi:hypothetical protein
VIGPAGASWGSDDGTVAMDDERDDRNRADETPRHKAICVPNVTPVIL